MDPLLKKLIDAAGVSGYEGEVASIMRSELSKSCDEVSIDNFGNVVGRKGKGKRRIMLAAHMDEVGLIARHVTKEGYIKFIKVGGLDDRVLYSQRVIIKSKKGDILGVIGAKPPHAQKESDARQAPSYAHMFIDIGSKDKKETEKKVEIGDAVIFEPNSGVLNGKLCYGKCIDDRVGCYALLKIMEKIKTDAEIYGVATVQEEVGLKGARTSSFKIDPDYAIAIDTTVAGDSPGFNGDENVIKLGGGVSVTIMEANGRGIIVSEKMRKIFVDTAKKNDIKYQMDILEGGMTDGAMIYMNREGVPTGVLSIPTRYLHSATGVFSLDDVDAAVKLAVRSVERLARE